MAFQNLAVLKQTNKQNPSFQSSYYSGTEQDQDCKKINNIEDFSAM